MNVDASGPFPVHAFTPRLRALGALLHAGALGTLCYFTVLLFRDVLAGSQETQPGPLATGLAVGGLLPLIALRLLHLGTRATVTVRPEGLVLTQPGGAHFEIPFEALASVRPWRLPIPGPGLTLMLRTGRAFDYGLELQDPVPLLTAMGPLGEAREHPLVRYAQARNAKWRRRWYDWLLKYGLVPGVISGIFFRAHQYISFGGAFGEWQMYGLKAYLLTFVRTWLPVFLALLLFGCFWRALVEALCFGAAWLGPRWARHVRTGAEWTCRGLYYIALPAFLAMRLLA
ncbi:hypothetical protein D7Y13_37585 [Corallococcus praedator]|uniref:Uncharacterized protein n=1 Tax=Corallococcus praedator TaxID=2316724 RepID=A0ABX9Q7V3_9BACT|nr:MULTISPECIES: hypothetical protein [Corallococcus]RKH19215.1 hypothetical protein D7X75_38915 [Corallococcus sp. CA031C]RKH92237.1 hypothetical protein D7Y13_37585 [Corallococcus praedator]